MWSRLRPRSLSFGSNKSSKSPGRRHNDEEHEVDNSSSNNNRRDESKRDMSGGDDDADDKSSQASEKKLRRSRSSSLGRSIKKIFGGRRKKSTTPRTESQGILGGETSQRDMNLSTEEPQVDRSASSSEYIPRQDSSKDETIEINERLSSNDVIPSHDSSRDETQPTEERRGRATKRRGSLFKRSKSRDKANKDNEKDRSQGDSETKKRSKSPFAKLIRAASLKKKDKVKEKEKETETETEADIRDDKREDERDDKPKKRSKSPFARLARAASLTKIFRKSKSPNPRNTPTDDASESPSVSSHPSTENGSSKSPNRSRRSLSGSARRLVKSLNVFRRLSDKDLFRFGSSSRNLNVDENTIPNTSGSRTKLQTAHVAHYFTRSEWEMLLSHESMNSFERCVSIFGDCDNLLLISQLAEFTERFDDFIKVLHVIRGVDTMAKMSLMYHLHAFEQDFITRDQLGKIFRSSLLADDQSMRNDPASLSDNPVKPSFLNRIRLEVFYSVHAPSKLCKIDEILEKYRGKEQILWTKLANQYKGVKIPTDEEVARVMPSINIVDELVAEAFAECSSREVMSFKEFCRWHRPNLDITGYQLIPWDELLDLEQKRFTELAGWVRFAEVSKHQGKRLSDVHWRRRWCSLETQDDGTTKFSASKTKTEKPFYTTNMSRSGVSIMLLSREGHKHLHTVLLDEEVYLQISSASEHSLENWLSNLRYATYTHAAPKKPSTKADPKMMETRIRAFYVLNNPSKLHNVKEILAKYAGREDKLVVQLEKQYDGLTVPPYEQALVILEEHLVKASKKSTEQSEEEDEASNHSQEELSESQGGRFASSDGSSAEDEDYSSDEESGSFKYEESRSHIDESSRSNSSSAYEDETSEEEEEKPVAKSKPKPRPSLQRS